MSYGILSSIIHMYYFVLHAFPALQKDATGLSGLNSSKSSDQNTFPFHPHTSKQPDSGLWATKHDGKPIVATTQIL